MIDLPYVLEQAQQQIAAQEPDVLLFTDIGFDALTYYLAHARLAPYAVRHVGAPADHRHSHARLLHLQ